MSNKVAFIMFRTLGDICMATTVVHALKEKSPDDEIHFITQAQNVHILEGNPDISKIIVRDNYYEANLYCVENKYDKILRAGMANNFDSIWHHIESQNKQHLVEWYAKRAGLETLDDKSTYVYMSEDDVADVDDYWNEPDIDKNKKHIVMHTTSGVHGNISVPSRDWPIEKFTELARGLMDKGYGIIQIGGFMDKKIQLPGVVHLTGKVSFKQSGELIKRCDGYIGVDSGPAYLAGWAGVPSIVIMGATQNTCDSSGPSVGPREDTVCYVNAIKPDNPACSPVPCYTACQIGKKIGCIEDVPTQVIFNQILSMLDEKMAQSPVEAPRPVLLDTPAI